MNIGIKTLCLFMTAFLILTNCSTPEGYVIENRKLTWEDFEGAEPFFSFSAIINNHTAIAMTYTQLKLSRTGPASVQAWCEFVKGKSFVRERVFEQSANIIYKLLEHEQGHYDICILHSRILRKKIKSSLFTNDVGVLRDELNYLFYETFEEMKQMNLDYDNQTGHGHSINGILMFPLRQQKVWTRKINNLKSKYWLYANNKEIRLKFLR